MTPYLPMLLMVIEGLYIIEQENFDHQCVFLSAVLIFSLFVLRSALDLITR